MCWKLQQYVGPHSTHDFDLSSDCHATGTNLFYWEDSYPSSSLEELVVCPDGLSAGAAVAPRGWETEKEHQSSSLLVMIMLVTLMQVVTMIIS